MSELLFVLSAVSASGWILNCFEVSILLVILILTPFGGRSAAFSRLRTLVVLILLLNLVVCQSRRLSKPNFCFEPSTVVSVEGSLICDSSFSANGNHLMRISLARCTDFNGNTGSAGGVMTVVGKKRYIMTYGMDVSLAGRFRDGFFLCDSVQVIRRSVVNDFREKLIARIERRVLGDSPTDSDLLSCALVLGRSDEGEMPLKEKARLCGVSHAFALSGMHLGILTAMCTRLFGKRRLGRAVSTASVLCFVFLAGPRPSLVRAAILFLLSWIPLEERTLLCLLVQGIMFPYSLTDIGCLYSYVAIIAIVFLKPYVASVLGQVSRSAGKYGCMTVCILLLSIPLQMIAEGQWHPACILLSLPMGLLAGCSMTVGLVQTVLGRLGILQKVNGYIYSSMDTLLGRFSSMPSAGWLGYGALVLSVAIPCVSYLLVRHLIRKRGDGHRAVIDLKSEPNVNSKP